MPDPSTDSDLWSGSWEFRSATLFAGLSDRPGNGSVELDESGDLRLQYALELGSTGVAATLCIDGRVAAASDDVLALACDHAALSLSSPSDEAGTIVATCAKAAGLALQSADGAWVASTPLPTLQITQLYLDQDCHIVRVLGSEAEGEGNAQPLVLFKK